MRTTNFSKVILLFLATALFYACGNDVHLEDATSNDSGGTPIAQRGDILVLSGGTVASNVAPYPLHQISVFDSSGNFKSAIYRALSGALLMGMSLDLTGSKVLLTVDNVDRVDYATLSSGASGYHLIDANLTGATMRAVEVLSDGSTLVAESTTSIEKFNAAGTRVTTGFPITAVNTVTNIRRISGDRFIALGTLGTDNPRVYSNAGALVATVPTSGATGCGTNCDPFDMIELSDGRFVATFQAATHRSLELFNSNFGYVGQLYRNSSVLMTPTSLAQKANGNLVVCDTSYNVCEEFSIQGVTASRVGTVPLIGNASVMRQPTRVLVVP